MISLSRSIQATSALLRATEGSWIDWSIAFCYTPDVQKIVYQKAALKGLKKVPIAMATKFRQQFRSIADGNVEHLDIKKLTGREGFRLRIGKYRAIFEIFDGDLVVHVLNVGTRGDIYKK